MSVASNLPSSLNSATRRSKLLSLLPAALVAWVVIVAKWLVLDLLRQARDSIPFTIDPELFRLLLLVGGPLAIVVTLMLGAPAWVMAKQYSLSKASDAALVGAGAGFVVYLANLFFMYSFALPVLPLWLLNFIDLAVGVFAGASAGMVSRWAAGIARKTA